MSKIIVFLEQRNNIIKKSSFEAAKTAHELGLKMNCEVSAVTIGAYIENITETGNYGIKKVVHLKHAELANYSSSFYTKVLSEYILNDKADIIIFSNTALGKDLSPHIAIRLNAGIIVDCTELNYENGELLFTRPIYAGKALANIKLKSEKKIITLRPNVFKSEKISSDNAESEVVEISDVALNTKVIEIKKSDGKIDVSEADIIVSGGRGMKGPENWKLIEDLSDVLGAATGASRAAVDAGWRPHSEQVGQTGKTVSPTLYVAVGISGAIQHLAGMRSSKYIVAINKDKDAPIFQVADYGIAGDAFEVVPVLIEELKKIKSN